MKSDKNGRAYNSQKGIIGHEFIHKLLKLVLEGILC